MPRNPLSAAAGESSRYVQISCTQRHSTEPAARLHLGRRTGPCRETRGGLWRAPPGHVATVQRTGFGVHFGRTPTAPTPGCGQRGRPGYDLRSEQQQRAISSAGERYLDTVEVTGSIPVSRTSFRRARRHPLSAGSSAQCARRTQERRPRAVRKRRFAFPDQTPLRAPSGAGRSSAPPGKGRLSGWPSSSAGSRPAPPGTPQWSGGPGRRRPAARGPWSSCRSQRSR